MRRRRGLSRRMRRLVLRYSYVPKLNSACFTDGRADWPSRAA